MNSARSKRLCNKSKAQAAMAKQRISNEQRARVKADYISRGGLSREHAKQVGISYSTSLAVKRLAEEEGEDWEQEHQAAKAHALTQAGHIATTAAANAIEASMAASNTLSSVTIPTLQREIELAKCPRERSKLIHDLSKAIDIVNKGAFVPQLMQSRRDERRAELKNDGAGNGNGHQSGKLSKMLMIDVTNQGETGHDLVSSDTQTVTQEAETP